MSVTQGELLSAKSGFESMKFTRNFTRVYRYYSSNIETDDEQAVLSAAFNQFRPRSPHPTFPFAYLMNINPTLVETFVQNGTMIKGALWDLEFVWSPLDPLTAASDGNPLNEPYTWTWSPENEDVVLYEDYEGNPLVNSAGDYFDPPIQRPMRRGILSVTGNFGVMDFETINSWGNTINSGPWQIWDAMKVMLMPVEIPDWQNSQEFQLIYWRLTFKFKIKDDENGWKEEILNQGYNELDDDGNRKLILVDGQPANSAQLLDEDGELLEPPVNKDDVVFLPFQLVQAIDFSQFGLDVIPYFPIYNP